VSEDVFLVDGVRTPQGRYGGMLASARPDDLALVVAEVASRSGVHGEAIDEVILGAADQAGEDNREGGRRGLATLCVGVGQGVAVLIEAV
jgi:acetyl-CoA acetyltransferase